MLLAIEFAAVFPDISPMPVAAYYKKLSLDEYKKRRLEMARVLINELKPEYLTLGNEPDTEAHNTGQPVNDAETYSQMIQFYTAELKRLPSTTTKLGAGFGTWLKDYELWTRRYAAQTGLDFINIHIYPVMADLMDRALQIADVARQNGKGIVMHEAWLYKWQLGEDRGGRNPNNIYSKDAYRFWYPLDQKFITAIVKMAHYKKFDYISPFWSNYLFAYLDYDQAKNLQAGERVKKAITTAVNSALAHQISPTGETYKRLISP